MRLFETLIRRFRLLIPYAEAPRRLHAAFVLVQSWESLRETVLCRCISFSVRLPFNNLNNFRNYRAEEVRRN